MIKNLVGNGNKITVNVLMIVLVWIMS